MDIVDLSELAPLALNLPEQQVTSSQKRGGRRIASPALLEPAFNGFTARTDPAPLGHVLQVMQYSFSASFFGVMGQPDLGQTLVWWLSPATLPKK